MIQDPSKKGGGGGGGGGSGDDVNNAENANKLKQYWESFKKLWVIKDRFMPRYEQTDAVINIFFIYNIIKLNL